MNRFASVAVIAGLLGLAGCATDTAKTSAPKETTASKDVGEVVTGSRLPRKQSSQPVQNVSKEDWNRSTSVIGNQPRGN